jgi:hemerythrin
MSALAWSDELSVSQPVMDATHREFIDLLAVADAALGGEPAPLIACFAQLVDHTVEHFAQEDRWMAATGFAPENCHGFQHKAVLDVMVECLKRAREQADLEPLSIAVKELAIWFPQHARMMDAALADHMASLGYDPVSGERQVLELEGAAPITGCGGASCAT